MPNEQRARKLTGRLSSHGKLALVLFLQHRFGTSMNEHTAETW
jgi:hypothetical protein